MLTPFIQDEMTFCNWCKFPFHK